MKRVAVFAFYFALAIALTWPLALELNTAVADHGDPLLNAFIIDWNAHALSHDPLHLFQAPIFYPAKLPLAFSEHMTGIAIFMVPLHLAGLGAVATHNLAILFSFALAGFGAFVLAEVVTADAVASLIAGVFFAFVSFKFDHLAHVQVIASGWIPLTLAALFLFHRTGSVKHATLFAAAFVMNGLTNVYWLMFTSFAVAVTIVLMRGWNRRRLNLALLAAALVLLPFLIPYEIVSKVYGMQRTSFDSRGGSATWIDWITASSASLLYGRGGGHPERHLFPGLLPIALAAMTVRIQLVRPRTLPFAIATVLAVTACFLVPRHQSDVPFTLAAAFALAAFPTRWTETAIAWLWVAIGFVGSFGENSFLHPFLFRLIEPMRATRTPARWAIIAYCGLAVVMAIGAARLRKARWVLLALAIVEVVPRFAWQHVPAQFPPVYAWLAEHRPAAAIELPIGWNETEASYVLANSVHRVPIMNGVSGFDTPLHRQLSQASGDALAGLIAGNGVNVVIVHPGAPAIHGTEIARFPDGDAVMTIAAEAATRSAPRR